MKAIIENKNTYKIISEKGDFFISEDNKGKLKMFAKKNVSVIEIAEMPKAKKYSNHEVSNKVANARANEHAVKIVNAEYFEHKF